jgi:tetratricopeptide (TPR) repeat protein
MGFMTSRFVVAAVLVATGLLHAPTATAQTYDQLTKWCYGDATDDQSIQGCNAVIQSGKETKNDLAAAFNNRGLAYDNKKEYDRAIQDYDQAIKLNPNNAHAFNNRGLAYANKGDNDRAIQDYDQAIKLNPNDAVAIKNLADAVAKRGN